MTLSAVLIARDEEANIRPCFDTFWPHVDEVVLCDTGSADGTIEAARAYAEWMGQPEKLVIGRFGWCDDFAAARNHAHGLATRDWHVWLDLDDRIVNAVHLRSIAAEATADVVCFPYAYRTIGTKSLVLARPRLLRAGAVNWVGRVHEFPEYDKAEAETSLAVVVKHTRTDWTADRYDHIIEQWLTEEPTNPLAIHHARLSGVR
jgi:glycosyltransferase involved in cell wall biosynthesis